MKSFPILSIGHRAVGQTLTWINQGTTSTRLLIFILCISAVLITSVAFVYHKINFDLLGTWGPNYNTLTIWREFEGASGKRNLSWTISYEGSGESTYSGIVRHISPIRVYEMPILTHNVLITSGDFADPNQVGTVVMESRLIYYYPVTLDPQGEIDLIHTIPLVPGLYQKLLEVKNGDIVTITGREVLEVQAFNSSGTKLSNWKDNGCNTLLVTSLSIN